LYHGREGGAYDFLGLKKRLERQSNFFQGAN
jgi:hypothetical protein